MYHHETSRQLSYRPLSLTVRREAVMPEDVKVRMSTAVAAVLWPIAVVLVLAEIVAGHNLGELGILVCAAACVLQIRGFFHMLSRREQNAFEIGMSAGRMRTVARDD